MRTTPHLRPKKFLGQHFLHDRRIAQKIVDSLESGRVPEPVLEIGPGKGVLTKLLLERNDLDLWVIEIDPQAVDYLKITFPAVDGRILKGDFLDLDLDALFRRPFSIIGNLPYNISSQILFKILEHRDKARQVICMLQKEVADRIKSGHGNKTYGILSVLIQAYYRVEPRFTVGAGAFIPPPSITSSVIRLTRLEGSDENYNQQLFFKVVKQAFNNRRKTLRNAVKNLNLPAEILTLSLLDKRAEQLSVKDFIHLTRLIQNSSA